MGNPRTSHGGFLLGKSAIFMGENSVAMFVYWMVLAIFNEKKTPYFRAGAMACLLVTHTNWDNIFQQKGA